VEDAIKKVETMRSIALRSAAEKMIMRRIEEVMKHE